MTNRNMRNSLRIALLFIVLLIALSIFPAVAAQDSVTTSDYPFADKEYIYVAGDPDNFPIEYYNAETKQFEGIMPKILEKVSEETGYKFCYLRGNEEDQRERMAQNGQVEIVTSISSQDKKLVSALKELSSQMFSVTYGTRTESYSIGFSVIAGDEVTEKISEALNTITKDDIIDFAINSSGSGYKNTNYWLVALIVAVTIIILAALFIFFYIRCKKNKEEPSDANSEDKHILSLAEFSEFFDDSISEEARSVYVISYLSFDTESLARSYGIASVSHQLTMYANKIAEYKGEDDIVTCDETGIILARVSGGNTSTEIWIKDILEKLNGTIPESSRLYVRAGIYRLTRNDNNCSNAISNAHQSYLSAASEKKPYAFCTEDMLKKIIDVRQMAEDAEKGFEDNQFKLYLQLTVGADSRKIVGAEALTRWEHPTKGLIHPGTFLPALAENGYIQKMDYYVFELVCKQLQEWKNNGINLYISCNFTRNTIDNASFADKILECASKYDFDRSNLVIEITEEVLESNREVALANITACSNAGFRIALDDLGSGVTSFSDLRDYPIDIIKIDRSILTKAVDGKGQALLGAIIHMAEELKLLTVCEGVENEEQAEMLKNLNCRVIQGYLFYRPMPATIVCDYIKENKDI